LPATSAGNQKAAWRENNKENLWLNRRESIIGGNVTMAENNENKLCGAKAISWRKQCWLASAMWRKLASAWQRKKAWKKSKKKKKKKKNSIRKWRERLEKSLNERRNRRVGGVISGNDGEKLHHGVISAA